MTQDKVLATIRRFWNEHGYSPSISDLVREVPLSSTSIATRYLERLVREGKIRRTPGVARSIVLPPNRILVEVDGMVTGIRAQRPEDVVVIALYPRCGDLQNVWQADGDDELFRIKLLNTLSKESYETLINEKPDE